VADRVLVLRPPGTGPGHREDPPDRARTVAHRRGPQPRTGRRAYRLPKRQGCRHRRRRVPWLRRREKVNGRKRFIVTDTLGLLLTVTVCTAGRQDREGAKTILLATYLTTAVRFIVADGGVAGRLLDRAQTFLRTTIEVVRKPAGQRRSAVIPRRWAVERTFARLTAHRRLARDHERDPAISEAMIRRAAINTMTRRLARAGPATRQQRRTFTPAR
jgi:transposase